MPTVEISDQTMARLQKMAVPFVDTPDTAIARLLDQHEKTRTGAPEPGAPVRIEGNTMYFDPENPPSLSFTTLKRAVLDNEPLSKEETYWNTLMFRMIAEAGGKGHDAGAILRMLSVNAVLGQKEDNGYRYLPEAGLSVQGRDSNGAFRQSVELAKELGIGLRIVFEWQNTEKAAHPGRRGVFELA